MTAEHSTLIGHLMLFLTTVAGFVFQWLREGRRHRWQAERFKDMSREIQNGHDTK